MPLLLTSNAIFPVRAMPFWLQSIAVVNPISYAVTPMRIVATEGWQWYAMWPGMLLLTLMAAGSVLLAMRQFERGVK